MIALGGLGGRLECGVSGRELSCEGALLLGRVLPGPNIGGREGEGWPRSLSWWERGAVQTRRE